MKYVVAIVLVLVFIAGGALFINDRKMEILDAPDSDETELQVAEKESMLEDPQKDIKTHPEVKTAVLLDVSGGTSSGTGYVLRENGMLTHYVEASLPEPEGKNLYEGWLVKQSPELEFFSTGIMKSQVSGTYELTYENEQAREGFDFVVITEETVIDDTPEKHIIEGLAE